MLTQPTNHQRRYPKGQGLLEVIIAIFIIVASVLGTTSVIVATIRAGRIAADRLTAMNLAREGIELVRNIRDSNWLTSGSAWDTGIADPAAGDIYAVPSIPTSTIFNPATEYTKLVFRPTSWTTAHLDCGGVGIVCSKVYAAGEEYTQGGIFGGEETRFSRLLSLTPLCMDPADPDGPITLSPLGVNTVSDDCVSSGGLLEVGIQVISEVRWPDNGITAHRVILEDRLFNWK